MPLKIHDKLKHLNPNKPVVDASDVEFSGYSDGGTPINTVDEALTDIYAKLNAEPVIHLLDKNQELTTETKFDFDMFDTPTINFSYSGVSTNAQVIVSSGTTTYLSGRYRPGELISVSLPKVTAAGQKIFTISVTDLNNGKNAIISITHIYGGIQFTSRNFSQNLSKLVFTDAKEVYLQLDYTLSYYEANTYNYYLEVVQIHKNSEGQIISDNVLSRVFDTSTGRSEYFKLTQTATGNINQPITLTKSDSVDYEFQTLGVRAVLMIDDDRKNSNMLSDNVVVLSNDPIIVTDVISVTDGDDDGIFDTDSSMTISARLFTNIPAFVNASGADTPVEIRYTLSGDSYSSSNLEGVPTRRAEVVTLSLGRLPKGNYTVTLSGHASDNDDTGINTPDTSVSFEILEAEDTTVKYVTASNRNLIAYFNSEGKNNSVNKDYWYAENNRAYYFKLNNFDYTETGSGWSNATESDDPSTVLKFTSSSYASLYHMTSEGSTAVEKPFKPMQLFDSAATADGQTLEIVFKSTCIGELNTSVLTCYNESEAGSGGYCAKFDSLSAVNKNKKGASRKISDNQWTHVTFVFDNNIRELNKLSGSSDYEDVIADTIENCNPFMSARIYIDGCLSSIEQLDTWGFKTILGNSDNTKQLLLNAAYNNLGNPDYFGSCEIKMIRLYGAALTSEEVLQNYISTIRNRETRLSVNQRNITSTSPIPVIRFVANKEAILPSDVKKRFKGWESVSNGNFSDLHTIKSKKEQYDDKGNLVNGGRTSKNYYVNCTMWYTYFDGTTFDTVIYRDVDVYLQGTSSLTYPVKNYQIKLYDAERAVFDDSLQRWIHGPKLKFNPPNASVDDGWFEETADYVYTLKCDYMEQSHRNNTCTARFYETLMDDMRTNFTSGEDYSDKYSPAAQITKTVTYTDRSSGETKTLNNQRVYRDAINGFPSLVYYNDNPNAPASDTLISEYITPSLINLQYGRIITSTVIALSDSEDDTSYVDVTYDDDIIKIGQNLVTIDIKSGKILTNNLEDGSSIFIQYNYYFDCNVPVSGTTDQYNGIIYDNYAGSYMFNVDKEGKQLGFDLKIDEAQEITYPTVDSDGRFVRDSGGNIVYETVAFNGRNLTHNSLPCVSLEGTSNTSGASAGAFYSYETYKANLEKAGLANPYKDESEYLSATLDPRYTFIEDYEDDLGGEDSASYKSAYDRVVYNRLRGTIMWIEDTLSDETYSAYLVDDKYVYNGKTYSDIESVRKERFRNEFRNYFSYTYCLAYYLQMLVFTQIDNAGKNAMWDSWGGVLYPRPYDMDTQMGLDNSGKDAIVVGAELSYLEDSTLETGKYTSVAECYSTYDSITKEYKDSKTLPRFVTGTSYNTTDSNLWTSFSKYFADEIATVYRGLRASGTYSVSNICNLVDSMTKEVIGETFYNKDAVSKYINTLDIDNYLFACQGNRASRYKNFLEQRITFLDTKFKYIGSDSLNKSITFRSNLPQGQSYFLAKIVIQVYSPQYVTINMQQNNSYTYYIDGDSRYHDDKTGELGAPGALIHLPVSASNADWTIEGAGNIKLIERMENLNLTFVQIGNARKLTNLSINDATALTEVDIGNNVYLRNVNLSGCSGFAEGKKTLSLENCINLKTLDISNTNLTDIILASGSPLNYLNIKGSQLTSLSLTGLYNLSSDTKLNSLIVCDKDTKVGTPPITSLLINDCPLINGIPYGLESISSLTLKNMPKLTSFTSSAKFTNFKIEGCDNLISINLTGANLSNLQSDSDGTSGDKVSGLLKLSTVPNLKTLILKNVSSASPITVQLANTYKLKSLDISNSAIADIRTGSIAHSRNIIDLTNFELNSFNANSNKQITEVRNLKLQPLSYNDDFAKTKPQNYMVADSSHATGYKPNVLATQSNYVTSMSSIFYECDNLEAVSGEIINCYDFTAAFKYANHFRALSYKLVDVSADYPNGVQATSTKSADYKLVFTYDDDFDRMIKYRDYETDNNGGELFSVSADSMFFNINVTDTSGNYVSGWGITRSQIDVFSTRCPYVTLASSFTRSNKSVTTCPTISSWYRLRDAWGFAWGSGITSVPDKYFDAAANNITTVTKAFLNCTDLTTVGSNIFKNLKKLTRVVETFSGCTKLTSIFGDNYDIMPTPTDGSMSNNIEDISGLFRGCSKLNDAKGSTKDLTSLFEPCRKLKRAEMTFRSFHKLTSIPDGVLQYNTNLVSINGLFAMCGGIKEVPNYLFISSPDQTDVKTHPYLLYAAGLFSGCYSMGSSTDTSRTIVRKTLLKGAENLKNIGYDMCYNRLSDGYSRCQVAGMFALTPIRGYEIGFLDGFTKLENISYLFSTAQMNSYAGSSEKTTAYLYTNVREGNVDDTTVPLINDIAFKPYIVNNDGTITAVCDTSSIDVDIFKNLNKLKYADGVFAGRHAIEGFCVYNDTSDKYELKSIYATTDDGTEKNGYVTDEDGQYLFELIDLSESPTIFNSENNPNLKTVDRLFEHCTGLSNDYHNTIFRHNPGITSAKRTFFDCTGLSGRIDENMFIGSKLTHVNGLLCGCSSLCGRDSAVRISVPNKLLQPIKSTIVQISYLFANSGLAGQIGVGSNEVPEGDDRTNIGLLSGLNVLTDAEGLFQGCKRLKGAIPQDIFYDPNTTVFDVTLTNISKMFAGCYGLGFNYGTVATAPTVRGGNPQTVYGELSASVNTASSRFIDYLIPDNWLGRRNGISSLKGVFNNVHSNKTNSAASIYPSTDSNKLTYPMISSGSRGDNYLIITNNSLNVTVGDSLHISNVDDAFSWNSALYGELNYSFLNTSHNSLSSAKAVFANCTSLQSVGSSTSTIFAPQDPSVNSVLLDLSFAFYGCTALSGYGPKLNNLSTSCNTTGMVQNASESIRNQYTSAQCNGANDSNQFNFISGITLTDITINNTVNGDILSAGSIK